VSVRLGLLGARGHTGRELIALIAGHPGCELVRAASSQQDGEPIATVVPEYHGALRFCSFTDEELFSTAVDAWILALPNGQAQAWAARLIQHHAPAVILDLSADHRLDPAWVFGLPEHHRAALRGARRIANPGCYATAALLALWPWRQELTGVPRLFGVSGYSGAGASPSPRNDPARLADNLLPYQLTAHPHQSEIGREIGRDVVLVPHVAPFFRGLVVTASFELAAPPDDEPVERYRASYRAEPLLEISPAPAEPATLAGRPGAVIGGAQADPRDRRRLVVTVALDNLLKGAAVQAMQNLNLALGFEEGTGLGL